MTALGHLFGGSTRGHLEVGVNIPTVQMKATPGVTRQGNTAIRQGVRLHSRRSNSPRNAAHTTSWQPAKRSPALALAWREIGEAGGLTQSTCGRTRPVQPVPGEPLQKPPPEAAGCEEKGRPRGTSWGQPRERRVRLGGGAALTPGGGGLGADAQLHAGCKWLKRNRKRTKSQNSKG